MKAQKDILETLHGSVAKELLDRIRSGVARPADMANAFNRIFGHLQNML